MVDAKHNGSQEKIDKLQSSNGKITSRIYQNKNNIMMKKITDGKAVLFNFTKMLLVNMQKG